MHKTQNIPFLEISVRHYLHEMTQLNDIQCANDPNFPLESLSDFYKNLEITKICKKSIELMK